MAAEESPASDVAAQPGQFCEVAAREQHRRAALSLRCGGHHDALAGSPPLGYELPQEVRGQERLINRDEEGSLCPGWECDHPCIDAAAQSLAPTIVVDEMYRAVMKRCFDGLRCCADHHRDMGESCHPGCVDNVGHQGTAAPVEELLGLPETP